VTQEREESKDPRGPQCHECSGYGHIRIHCGNLRMNNGRALQVTLSDDEETSGEGNFMAFTSNFPLDENVSSSFDVRAKSSCSNPFLCSEDKSQVNPTLGISFNSDDESNDSSCSSEDAIEEHNPFELLMEKFNFLRKGNNNLVEKVRVLEVEKSKLIDDLKDAHAICNTLKYENHVLISKVKTLEKDLEDSRNHLKRFDNGKLDEMLSNQKFAYAKTSLGFNKFAASSSKSNPSPKKIVFVKAANMDGAPPKGEIYAPCQTKKVEKKVATPHPKVKQGKKGKSQPPF
jgi:uncharacterized protein (UPF0335 family)